MSAIVYYRQGLTGNGATDLDGVDGAVLSDGDPAFVFDGSTAYVYRLDATSGAAESSPDVISPDSNAGTKRWILQSVNTPPEIAGVVKVYAGSTAPTGYLFCDGASLSRTTYSGLFAIIGTAFGSVDGASFNVPDLRGRVPLGKDDMGGSSANRVVDSTADTLGGGAGAETHTLSTAEMPAHTHSVETANTITDTSGDVSTGTVDRWTDDLTTVTGAAGSNSPHSNMQPYQVLNYIIKT